jgi:hypothetical protein
VTVLEVVVALVIVATLLLAGRSLFETSLASAAAMRRAAADADRRANGEWMLRELVGQMEPVTATAAGVRGDERRLHFSSWCRVPGGWSERCEVLLAADTLGGRAVIAAALSTGETLVLRSAESRVGFRYLLDPSRGGSWVPVWGTSSAAPAAIGVVVDDDTLIVRVGDRG